MSDNTSIETDDLIVTKPILRAMMRGTYDLQSLRVETGNRIGMNFRAKLGLLEDFTNGVADDEESDESSDEDDGVDDARQRTEKEAKKALAILKLRYERITDGIVEVTRRRKYDYDGVISNYTELCLVGQYLDLLKKEQRHFRDLGHAVESFSIWSQFLNDVRGVGPALASIIISEIDIHKARYPSSLHAYAGLDVVTTWVLQGTKVRRINLTKTEPVLDLPLELPALERQDNGETVCVIDDDAEVTWRGDDPSGVVRVPDSSKAVDAQQGAIVLFRRDGYEIEARYRLFQLGGRSRRKEHLIDVEYKAKDGTIKTRKSITFNPFLKTKLIGVLGPSFLRAGGKYKDLYNEYKFRISNMPQHMDLVIVDGDGPVGMNIAGAFPTTSKRHKDGFRFKTEQGFLIDKSLGCYDDTGQTRRATYRRGKTRGHRHNMAVRYMVKLFLNDLYNAWRELEGLPVAPTYQEAKLGHTHRP